MKRGDISHEGVCGDRRVRDVGRLGRRPSRGATPTASCTSCCRITRRSTLRHYKSGKSAGHGWTTAPTGKPSRPPVAAAPAGRRTRLRSPPRRRHTCRHRRTFQYPPPSPSPFPPPPPPPASPPDDSVPEIVESLPRPEITEAIVADAAERRRTPQYSSPHRQLSFTMRHRDSSAPTSPSIASSMYDVADSDVPPPSPPSPPFPPDAGAGAGGGAVAAAAAARAVALAGSAAPSPPPLPAPPPTAIGSSTGSSGSRPEGARWWSLEPTSRRRRRRFRRGRRRCRSSNCSSARRPPSGCCSEGQASRRAATADLEASRGGMRCSLRSSRRRRCRRRRRRRRRPPRGAPRCAPRVGAAAAHKPGGIAAARARRLRRIAAANRGIDGGAAAAASFAAGNEREEVAALVQPLPGFSFVELESGSPRRRGEPAHRVRASGVVFSYR